MQQCSGKLVAALSIHRTSRDCYRLTALGVANLNGNSNRSVLNGRPSLVQVDRSLPINQ